MKDIGSIATQICDGMGVYKVFNKMTNYKIILEDFGEVELCNYVNLNADNKTLVLNMRNHPEIRKWMYNQDDILEDAHLRFIQSLENDIDRRYFLVKKHSNIIGSINFSQIDLHDSVEFGLYANPFESQKGLGAILEAIVTHYAFKELGVNKLKLEVLSNNERAINFYKKYGFKLIDARKVNNKDMLYMEKIKTLEEV
jgi:UDP-4-amino-4,6-dideoxy-N-acetyl-beta-L-altrosamine N-acetyltransferase